MVFFVASAKLFAEFPRVWMPFTWIPLQYIHISHLESSPYPSGLGCIIYCLAGENGEWVVKTPQTHSWMKLAALRANSRVRTRKLSNFDRRKSKHLNGFLCIHFRLGYKCCHIINFYLIKLYRLLSLYEENTNLRWKSVDKNRSNRFLTSAIRFHIFTRFDRYLHSKRPSRIITALIFKFISFPCLCKASYG